MKKNIFLFLVVCLCSSDLNSQNKKLQLDKIYFFQKGEFIKSDTTQEESLHRKKYFDRYDSLKINFSSKKRVIYVAWKKFKISGKYRVVSKSDSSRLKISFRGRTINLYENSSFERAEFATFFYSNLMQTKYCIIADEYLEIGGTGFGGRFKLLFKLE